ncbi:putative quinol monooxygenase [Mucilaginibacter celer]|uniref:Antibiotic biosynthesis monooxygenase n=1 Tax=Mucilaginibacter celer TaxID=2305508 RepID=A0A494VQF6_9SPHI|nr:putative quinol monooxygenase [Mucilaginibacter celer]AYL97786.1 antibiotic biosynthesis monooxygenase [Mucilaginibacter celer]
MEQQPVYVFAKWTVKQGELNTVLSLLAEVAQKSTAEEGNLFYNIHQSNTGPDTLILAEAYKDEAAVAAHRETAHFQNIVVGKIVPLLAEREVILTTRIDLG